MRNLRLPVERYGSRCHPARRYGRRQFCNSDMAAYNLREGVTQRVAQTPGHIFYERRRLRHHLFGHSHQIGIIYGALDTVGSHRLFGNPAAHVDCQLKFVAYRAFLWRNTMTGTQSKRINLNCNCHYCKLFIIVCNRMRLLASVSSHSRSASESDVMPPPTIMQKPVSEK